MLARVLPILAALTLAPAAQAQDLIFNIIHTQACLDEALGYTERRDCIGASASACMEATDMGYTTIGMSECTSRELNWWDARLNAVYQRLRAEERAEDAELASSGGGYQSQADALRDMQRAWIPFRDAKCVYERSQWMGGTGGGPAWLSCMLHETAEQTMDLEATLENY